MLEDRMNKNKLNFGFLFFCVISFSFILINSASAGTGEIVSIGSANVDFGGSIVLPITVENFTEVEGISLDLIYDSQLVTITSITANNSIPSSSLTTNTDVLGIATLVLTNSEYITASSPTHLVDITFRGEHGGVTALDLENMELTKDFVPYYPALVNNGELFVGDWNPWNDPDSDGGQMITDPELLELINCWFYEIPAPDTGVRITDERLLETVNLWMNE